MVLGEIPPGEVLAEIQTMCEEHVQLQHVPISFPDADLSRKKNYGIERSRADIVVVLDDDLFVPAEWLREITRPFEDPRVAMVIGPSLIPNDISFFGRLAGLVMASGAAGYVADRYTAKKRGLIQHIKWSHVIGCNMAFRKDIVQECGGFHLRLIPGEDLYLGHLIEERGSLIAQNPAASVLHYPRQSLSLFWKQIYRFGAARIRLMKHGVEWELQTLLPAVLILFLVVGGLLSVVSQVARLVVLVVGASYALFVTAVVVTKCVQTRRVQDVCFGLLIPVAHAAYGVAEWVEILRPGKDLSEVGQG